MAGWDGNGVFSRTYNWVQQAANGIKILASNHDANDTDFVNGINNCLTKDGQNSATANLPMATYKHTGVGSASSLDEYAAAEQLIDNDLIYYTASGTDTYAITPNPAISAYAAGQEFLVNFTNANTGAATLNVNSLGAIDIVDRSSNAISSGFIAAGGIYRVVYDGTNFQVQPKHDAILSEDNTFSGSNEFTGAVTISDDDVGATAAPTLTIFRDSASPADDDNLGVIAFDGNNSAAEQTIYATIGTSALDVTDATEDGEIAFSVMSDGSLTAVAELNGTGLNINGEIDWNSLASNTIASQAQQESGTLDTVVVTPSNQQYHPSAIQARIKFNGSTNVVFGNLNASTITDNSTGNYTVNFDDNMSDANYSAVTSCEFTAFDSNANVEAYAASGVTIITTRWVDGDNTGFYDATIISVIVSGSLA